MKLGILGASGMIGSRILAEALARGHEVTAIVRDASRVTRQDRVRVAQADALQVETVLAAAEGLDVLISAYGPGRGPGTDIANLSRVAHNLIRVVAELGIPRLIVVGGAGSLEVAPGLLWYDSPEFPEAYRMGSKAQGDALAVYRASDIDWTYFSPARDINPGERTGRYRLGADQLLIGPDGTSRISAEDYAAALIDEVENPQAIRRRFTAGY